jgi:hypothetical protein
MEASTQNASLLSRHTSGKVILYDAETSEHDETPNEAMLGAGGQVCCEIRANYILVEFGSRFIDVRTRTGPF